MELHISCLNMTSKPVSEIYNDTTTDKFNNCSKIFTFEICFKFLDLFNKCCVSFFMCFKLITWIFLQPWEHFDFSVEMVDGIIFHSLNCLLHSLGISGFCGVCNSVDQIEEFLMVSINISMFASIFFIGPYNRAESWTTEDWSRNQENEKFIEINILTSICVNVIENFIRSIYKSRIYLSHQLFELGAVKILELLVLCFTIKIVHKLLW